MAKIQVFLCVFVLIFIDQSVVHSTKLNYPRVLLPIFEKISINFTLEVIEKGCFKWTSSRQDLILITPLYEDEIADECSYRAKVTVLTRERRRNTAIVLAEDMTTGESLRCDVILDVIDKLGVHTTTRQLYLEEAPETFELRAEDSQGNAFTTLEGVEFNWAISSLQPNNKNWSPALRFLTFSESPYHVVPAALEKFEAQHIKGYMVLLEGINTGTAKVTVSMPYPEYSYVGFIEVSINVLANIILEPSEAHILAGDTITFRILQLKMGKLTEISLNDQYFLELEDGSVASIKNNRVTGVKLGRTSVVLRDRNVPQNQYDMENAITKSSIPSAQLTVAQPVKLGLSLLPHNNWLTVEGERHEIALDLYTSDEQKITLGSRYAMSSELDEMLFYVLKRNKNGSRLYGEAVREGVTPVYGSFKELTAQAELQIFSELVLLPNRVILPYDPNVIKTQKVQFRARGGDGSYVWQTQQPRLLHINQNGLATTVIRDTDKKHHQHDTFEAAGSLLTVHAHVKVSLTRNQKVSRQADIYFLPPVRLEIIKYNFETALKDYVRLHVAVYAYANETLLPYTKCENLIFDFEFSNQIFQVDYSVSTEEMATGACQVVHLRSTQVGMTQLKLSYNFQEKVLRDEVTLSVFEPLAVLNPVENELILPVGASRSIIYAHGPQRIFTLEAELTKITETDDNLIYVQELIPNSQNAVYAFTVLCQRLGETTLDFRVYNALTTPNFMPYLSHAVTRVHCVNPRFLNLYATEELRSSCPLEMRNSLLHLKDSDDKFEIEIEVQDAKNRKLMNISSLHIDWEFAAGEQRYQRDVIAHYRRTEEEIVEGVRVPWKDTLVTTITDVAPNFRIKGVVTRYDSLVLHKQDIYADEPPFSIKNPKTGEVATPVIENEIRFMAVNTTLFPSDSMSIFMSKNRRERIPLSQGSGYYDFQVSEPDIIKVEFDAKERELIVMPLRMGMSHIELIDRCLMSAPAHLTIAVVSIGAVTVEVFDRVEISRSIEAIVKLYDSYDNLMRIDPFNLQMYELAEHVINADILKIRLGDQMDLRDGEIRYIVQGNKLGETQIIFTAGSGDTQVASEPAHIQVFPPLRLYPRNTTLIIGGTVQLSHHGGPQPDVNLVYEVANGKVASIDSNIVTARLQGGTAIIGKCISTDPVTGKKVVISEDTVEVHVLPLRAIRLKTPLVRIRRGAVMPASIWGVPDFAPIPMGELPDVSPMIMGTLDMRVTWSTNQPDVIDIYNIFADAGIEYADMDLVSVRVKALNPGKAKIQATAELSTGEKFTSAVEVVVFKTLQLESPKQIAMDWILLAPRSTIQLTANLGDAVYKTDNEKHSIVKVTSDGMLRTADTLGRDLIIAKTFEQTLPIGVEVKNVQYILASLQYPNTKLKQTEEKIPRGMHFILKVSLHDNLGNEFSHNIEDVNGIKYELSQRDVVDVQIGNNLTLAINLPRETSNMIAISLKDITGVKHAEDYIKLSVAESKHFYPAKTILTVGDIICFDSPLTLSAIWSSSNEQIVSIDRLTGVARVLTGSKNEKVVITNGDKSSGSYIKYDVEVREADVLQLLKTYDIFSGTTYRAYFLLRHHLQIDKSSNLVAQNTTACTNLLEKIPVKIFTCHLKAKNDALAKRVVEQYKVTPIFEAETGRYACQIDLKTSFNEVLSIVKTNDVSFNLEVHLSNSLRDRVTLKFIPGVKVTPDRLLSDDVKEQEFTISGLDKVLQKVEVKPSDENVLQLIPHAKQQGLLQYKVKLLNELPADEQIYISVHSPSTMQNIQIPIQRADVAQTCATQPFSNTSAILIKIVSNIGLIITGLVILAASIWIYISFNPQNRVTEINQDVFSSTLKSKSKVADVSHASSNSPPQTPLYAPMSPYFSNRSPGSFPTGNESPVYGDTTLISPQNRINRRYL